MRSSSAEPRRGGGAAIVTGGAGGLGRSICATLADESWKVWAGDLAPALAESPLPAGVEPIELDVRDRVSIERAVERVESERGRVDLFVNNAGISIRHALEAFPEEDWLRLIEINLHGVFRGLQVAGRRMLAAGSGTIVNIASIAWARGAAGRAAYGVAKAGVVSITRSAAVEWGGRGVRVNAVAPGYVLTELNRDAFEAGSLNEDLVLARVPMARLGQPDEIAKAVAFLASPAAAYVNGHVLVVDGGFLADYGVPFEDR